MEEMLWPAIANECGEEALTKIANYEEGSFNNEEMCIRDSPWKWNHGSNVLWKISK